MTAATQLMPDTACVALDIAKRYHDMLVRWPDGREKVFKMPNTRTGHDDLIRFLSCKSRTPLCWPFGSPQRTFIGLLPTGWLMQASWCTSLHPWRGLGFEKHCIPRGTNMTERMRVF